jgi:hypothetical protein
VVGNRKALEISLLETFEILGMGLNGLMDRIKNQVVGDVKFQASMPPKISRCPVVLFLQIVLSPAMFAGEKTI